MNFAKRERTLIKIINNPISVNLLKFFSLYGNHSTFSFFCRYIAKASVRIKCTHMVLRKRASASHYQLIGNRTCGLVTMIPFAFCEKVSIGEHAKGNGKKNGRDRKSERDSAKERESGRFEVDQRTPAIIIEICALMRTASYEGLLALLLCCYRMFSLPPVSSSPLAVPNTVIYSPPGIVS